MGGIQPGDKVSAAVVNAAFMCRTDDTDTTGRVSVGRWITKGKASEVSAAAMNVNVDTGIIEFTGAGPGDVDSLVSTAPGFENGQELVLINNSADDLVLDFLTPVVKLDPGESILLHYCTSTASWVPITATGNQTIPIYNNQAAAIAADGPFGVNDAGYTYCNVELEQLEIWNGTEFTRKGGTPQCILVDQPGHTFVVGDPVWLDVNTGTWKKATTNLENSYITHLVVELAINGDADTFKVQAGGPKSFPAAHGLGVDGCHYFMDPASPGDVTDVEPSGDGEWNHLVYQVIDSDTIEIKLRGRPVEIVPDALQRVLFHGAFTGPDDATNDAAAALYITSTYGGGLLDGDTYVSDIGGVFKLRTYDLSAGMWVDVGSGAVSSKPYVSELATTITQAAHGFALFDQVYVDAAGTWLPADATDDTKDNIATVTHVVDANNFCIQSDGYAFIANALTVGDYYWVDPATPGAITATIPATPGDYQMPALRVLSASLVVILSSQRANIV